MPRQTVLSMTVAVGAACAALVIPAASAQAAAPKPARYRNCTALNALYPHGVAKPKATDRVRGKTKPVTTFTVNLKTYTLNTRLDRDHDGIACEKR